MSTSESTQQPTAQDATTVRAASEASSSPAETPNQGSVATEQVSSPPSEEPRGEAGAPGAAAAPPGEGPVDGATERVAAPVTERTPPDVAPATEPFVAPSAEQPDGPSTERMAGPDTERMAGPDTERMAGPGTERMAGPGTERWGPAAPIPPADPPGTVDGSSRPRRFLLLFGAVVGGVLLISMLSLFGLRAARAGVLPRMRVDNLEVGGLSEQELRAALEGYAGERGAEPVTATREAQEGDPRGPATFEATAADVGYVLDVDATAARVLERGRQANPLAALADHLRASSTAIEVDAVEGVDSTTLDGWVTEVADQLLLPTQEATVRFEGVEVVRVDPVPGFQVDTELLRGDASQAALTPGPDQVAIVTEPLAPTVTEQDVDAVYAQMVRAVSAPVTLTRDTDSVSLSPEQIATMLRVEPGPQGGLEVRADPAALAAVLGDPSPVDVAPKDAALTLTAGAVTVVEGEPGFRPDVEAAAQQVRDLATGEGPREAPIAGEAVEPERTGDDVRALGITQQVSTYTTQHPCCANRVQNIHRIADLVRGVIIEPGETFSVNDHVGQRTTANGFLADGAIQRGEFVQEVGGGVSQFATTMFNAAYEGGYEIVEHKPHSQYISRYPEGREATLNYPDVDLKVRNNSPYGVYVDTSYTGTSITVSFWSTPWVSVSSVTSPRRNITGPRTIVRTNPEVPPGQEVVVQEAQGQGFDVTVTRTLSFPDGRTESQDFFTTYEARPRIVERGPS